MIAIHTWCSIFILRGQKSVFFFIHATHTYKCILVLRHFVENANFQSYFQFNTLYLYLFIFWKACVVAVTGMKNYSIHRNGQKMHSNAIFMQFYSLIFPTKPRSIFDIYWDVTCQTNMMCNLIWRSKMFFGIRKIFSWW